MSLINTTAAAAAAGRQISRRHRRRCGRHQGRGRENGAIWPPSCKLPGEEDFFSGRRKTQDEVVSSQLRWKLFSDVLLQLFCVFFFFSFFTFSISISPFVFVFRRRPYGRRVSLAPERGDEEQYGAQIHIQITRSLRWVKPMITFPSKCRFWINFFFFSFTSW